MNLLLNVPKVDYRKTLNSTVGSAKWSGIVKVQVPLNGSGGLLVYNEDKTIMIDLSPIPPKLARKMGTQVKRYFHAVLENDGTLVFGQFAPWQEW